MWNRFLLVALVVLAPVAWAGEFTFEVTAGVNADRKPLLGAQVSVSVDPLWGQADEQGLQAYIAQNGPIPEVTVTGSGVTEKWDDRYPPSCKFTAKVSWDSDKNEPPTMLIKQRDGSQLESYYVHVLIEAKCDGHYTVKSSQQAIEGRDLTTSLPDAIPYPVYSGHAVLKDGKTPLANQKLLIRGMELDPAILESRPRSRARQVHRVETKVEFTTDADGKFSVTGPDIPYTEATLRILDPNLAFAPDSLAWQSGWLRRKPDGNYDFEKLVAVPGGSIRISAADTDTGAVVDAHLSLGVNWNGRSLTLWCGSLASESEISGIPAATYTVELRSFGNTTHWFKRVPDATVEAGKVTDMGVVVAEPYRVVEFNIVDESDTPVPQYVVIATYLGDDPPAGIGSKLNPKEPITVGSHNMTPENNKVSNLFSGRWRIEVRAQNLPNTTLEIDVPLSAPLKILLAQGGTITVDAKDWAGNEVRVSRWLAVRQDSPAYEEFKLVSLQELNAKFTFRPVWPEGVFHPSGGFRGLAVNFEQLPVGRYLVLGASDMCQVMRQDDIVVEPGKPAQFTLLPTPGMIHIRVTEDGRPASGAKVYVVNLRNKDSEPAQYTSDELGTVSAEVKHMAEYIVLSADEYSAVIENGDNQRGWRLQGYEPREVFLRHGQRAEVHVELANEGKTTITVEVQAPRGAQVYSPSLAPVAKPDRSQAYAQQDGDTFVFENVLNCAYWVSGTLRIGEQSVSFRRKIEPDAPKHKVKIKVEVGELEVTIKSPSGRSSAAGAEIELWQLEDREWVAARHAAPETRRYVYRADDKGKLKIPLIEQGQWYVVARATRIDPRLGRLVVDAAWQVVDVKKRTSLKLEFSGEVGTVSLKLPEGTVAAERWARLVLLDQAGTPIHTLDPALAFGSFWTSENRTDTMTVPLVPVGKYRAILVADGLMPQVFENLVVQREKTTELVLNPRPEILVTLAVDKVFSDPKRENITFVAEDAAGNPIPTYGTGLPGIRLNEMPVLRIGIPMLTPETTKVRVMIPGYKEIVVSVDLKSGKPVTVDVTAEPEK